MVRTVTRYGRTLRPLRPEQFFFRGWYAARACLVAKGQPGPAGAVSWKEPPPRVPFGACPWFETAAVASRRFRFLNDEADYGAGVDWEARGKSRLWRYNLHYFQFLLPEGGMDRDVGLGLIGDWLARVPPGAPDAWDPFPVSLRLVSWLKFLSRGGVAGRPGAEAAAQSAYRQTLWLERRLERQLLANHFFKNLKALAFAGLFFEGKDARRWLGTARRLLEREVPEQVLPDGAHFERSPMYHAMILEDCLDLRNAAAGRQEPDALRLVELLTPACRRMLRFLAGILHPDGEMALLNDSAFGIEPPAARLLAYGEAVLSEAVEAPVRRSWSFPDAGVHVLAPWPGDRLIVDCGPMGPDYQPGHAHCDTLSYELSLGGRRVVVDSGVHDYETGEMRRYVRSTAAHNTVRVDGEEQSEIWAAFRVGRRARPLEARLSERDGVLCFSGAHDGYRRLGAVHRREIEHRVGEGWGVRDRLEGRGRHGAESFVHLHPDFRAEPRGREVAVVERSGGAAVARLVVSEGCEPAVERGWYCPEFGLRLEQDVVVLRARGELPLAFGYRIVGT